MTLEPIPFIFSHITVFLYQCDGFVSFQADFSPIGGGAHAIAVVFFNRWFSFRELVFMIDAGRAAIGASSKRR